MSSLAHHDRGLATRIGLVNKDASGHTLDTLMSSQDYVHGMLEYLLIAQIIEIFSGHSKSYLF
jgi:hypothetical protein